MLGRVGPFAVVCAEAGQKEKDLQGPVRQHAPHQRAGVVRQRCQHELQAAAGKLPGGVGGTAEVGVGECASYLFGSPDSTHS